MWLSEQPQDCSQASPNPIDGPKCKNVTALKEKSFASVPSIDCVLSSRKILVCPLVPKEGGFGEETDAEQPTLAKRTSTDWEVLPSAAVLMN